MIEYDRYYQDKLKQGQEYEKFIVKEMAKLGQTITIYNTKEEQYNIGESKEGYEIKFDNQYNIYGNLYIELYEKTSPTNTMWYPSGVLRNDNTKYYIIGDTRKFWIFKKAYIQELIKERRVIENSFHTSKGVLLPWKQIEFNSKKVKIIQTK